MSEMQLVSEHGEIETVDVTGTNPTLASMLTRVSHLKFDEPGEGRDMDFKPAMNTIVLAIERLGETQ